jgi:hypothetical protein
MEILIYAIYFPQTHRQIKKYIIYYRENFILVLVILVILVISLRIGLYKNIVIIISP